MRLPSSRVFVVFLIILWLGLCAFGVHSIFLYEATPGAPGLAKQDWSSRSKISNAGASLNLLMIVHPHCPCSKASLSELETLMKNVEARVTAQVVFVKPTGVPIGWEQGELWNRAKAIPGVNVTVDEDGKTAERFGSRTSGQVMLLGAGGSLMFSGGITSGRGHVGDNAGRSAIEAIVFADETDAGSSMVYGCPLFDESTNSLRGN